MLSLPKAFMYCPRCAGRLQWAASRRFGTCLSCGNEIYDQPKIVVTGILHDDQGRILLVRRAKEPHKGKWDTPGGFVETGESAENALRREIKEEMGIRLGALAYVASFPGVYPYQGVGFSYLELSFSGKGPDIRRVRCDREEIAQLRYVHKEKIRFDQLAFASQRTVLRMVRNGAFDDL
ncbi:MAG: pyrophosphatase [Candidatus Parcubacteria bacterium]|jgi:mutator protein MutT